MFQLMYVSTAAWKMDNGDLNTILDISRVNNRRYGVTGLLLHLDHGFLQILEGRKDAVMEIFHRIERDRRHIGLRILVQQEVPERLFEGWNMGFDRWQREASRTAGVFTITEAAIADAIAPDKAADLAILLRSFYRVNSGNIAA